MQRSALQIEKEKSEEEKQKVIDDEHWVLDLPETEQKEWVLTLILFIYCVGVVPWIRPEFHSRYYCKPQW